jgi:hypothetical protein
LYVVYGANVAAIGIARFLNKQKYPKYVWWILVFVFLIPGFIVWILALGPGMPLCNPNSVFQGHGFWHVATAFVVLFILQLRL